MNFSSTVSSIAPLFLSLSLCIYLCCLYTHTLVSHSAAICTHLADSVSLKSPANTGSMTWFYQRSNPNISDHREHQKLRSSFFFFFLGHRETSSLLLLYFFSSKKFMWHYIALAYIINDNGLPRWH